jgi:formate/nitrite transporter FocA (FNT family)
MLATVLTGLIYNTSTIAEWQAVQTWRVEWLLATIGALLAALLFKAKP